ncbi:AMP-binding protein [Nocardia flavorosea]|uniref:AMP-binding protein n=1 Tax=Nocardia flavorosea TaxID=53429 RepID=UPI001E4AEE52|nr:AMP-binding protein [Nocardia flavorosea]
MTGRTTQPDETALTTADLLRRRADDDHDALLFEDSRWSWREFVAESSRRAHLLHDLRAGQGPFHVGVMLENVPEYLFMISGAALCGATVVGINLTRRGAELADDIRFTDCQLIITDSALAERLDGLDLGLDPERILLVDSPGYEKLIDRYQEADIPDCPAADDPQTRLLLLFTSGSTGRPKAVICSTGRFAGIASRRHMNLGRADISYNAMPIFHGNALMACWSNPLYTGGTFALARRFSASRFVDDLLKFEATYFNYVGRALAYILARPERREEKCTRLRTAFGTEASKADRAEFERRFGVVPTESYGASEGGLGIVRTPDTPDDALGRPQADMTAAILNTETLEECPPAEFDEFGRLLNADEAIGEMVNMTGGRMFEGYYKNPSAGAERVRGDIFLSGDLGYRDENGYFYFAGRSGEKIRVDSENFSAAPVERILSRYSRIALATVYPAPDERTGDQVMATFQMAEPHRFDPEDFAEFLRNQPDLGTKWAPKYIRIVTDVPITATRKINKVILRNELWYVDDPIFYRPSGDMRYRLLTAADRDRIEDEFETNGRTNLLATRQRSGDRETRNSR